MIKRLKKLLVALAIPVMAFAAPVYHESAKIGGGYGDSGIDLNADGSINADSTITSNKLHLNTNKLLELGTSGEFAWKYNGSKLQLLDASGNEMLNVTDGGTSATLTVGTIAATSVAATAMDFSTATLTGYVPIGNIVGAVGGSPTTKYLRGDGSWATISITGDVTGPGSSVDNAIPRFDSTTGKVIQNGPSGLEATIDDSGNLQLLGALRLKTGSYYAAITPSSMASNQTFTLPATGGTITALGNTINLATSVTGNLPVTSLGGGASGDGTKFFAGDGTWKVPSATGNTYGAASSTTNSIAKFADTTGKVLASYLANAPTVSDYGLVTIPGGLNIPNNNLLTFGSSIQMLYNSTDTVPRFQILNGGGTELVSIGNQFADGYYSSAVTAGRFKVTDSIRMYNQPIWFGEYGSYQAMYSVSDGKFHLQDNSGHDMLNISDMGSTGDMIVTGDLYVGGTFSAATLTANKFIGSGSTTDAVDLATAEVAGTLGSANGGTGNTYFAVSGPASSTKTYTFPNASGSVATSTGLGATAWVLGDIPYANSTPALTALAGNTTSTKKFLSQTGTGSVSAAPSWTALAKADVGLSSVEDTALSTWPGTSNITTLGTVTTGTWNSATKIGLAYGGTNANLSATGGTSQVLKQVSAGAAVTVGQLASSDLSDSSSVVLTTGTQSITGAKTFTSAITGPTPAPGINTAASYISFAGSSSNWPMGLSTIYDSSFVDQYITFNTLLSGGTKAAPTFTGLGGNGGWYIRNYQAAAGVTNFAIGTVPAGTGQAPTDRLTLGATGDATFAGNISAADTKNITLGGATNKFVLANDATNYYIGNVSGTTGIAANSYSGWDFKHRGTSIMSVGYAASPGVTIRSSLTLDTGGTANGTVRLYDQAGNLAQIYPSAGYLAMTVGNGYNFMLSGVTKVGIGSLGLLTANRGITTTGGLTVSNSAELVNNGTASTNPNVEWSAYNGNARVDWGSSAYIRVYRLTSSAWVGASIYQDVPVTIGKRYKLVYTLVAKSVTDATITIGSVRGGGDYYASPGLVEPVQTNTVYFTATTATATIMLGVNAASGSGQTADMDNVSLVEMGDVNATSGTVYAAAASITGGATVGSITAGGGAITGSSAYGTYFDIVNTSTGGIDWAIESSGSSSSIGVGKLAFLSGGSGGSSRFTLDSSGNLSNTGSLSASSYVLGTRFQSNITPWPTDNTPYVNFSSTINGVNGYGTQICMMSDASYLDNLMVFNGKLAGGTRTTPTFDGSGYNGATVLRHDGSNGMFKFVHIGTSASGSAGTGVFGIGSGGDLYTGASYGIHFTDSVGNLLNASVKGTFATGNIAGSDGANVYWKTPKTKPIVLTAAGAMVPDTGGAGTPVQATTGSASYPVYYYSDFSDVADSALEWQLVVPNDYDSSGGGITFTVEYVPVNTSGAVTFGLQALAIATNTSLTTAFPSATTVSGNATTAGYAHVSASGTIAHASIGGTMSAGNLLFIRLSRSVSDANTGVIHVIGVKIEYTPLAY